MFEAWRWANLTLAFALELGALAAIGLWGWSVGSSTPLRLVLAIGLPVVVATLWGLYAAPKSTFDDPWLAIATKVLVFGAAAVALWLLDWRVGAVAFVILVVVNLAAIKAGDLQAVVAAQKL
jgi:hypothetical protein